MLGEAFRFLEHLEPMEKKFLGCHEMKTITSGNSLSELKKVSNFQRILMKMYESVVFQLKTFVKVTLTREFFRCYIKTTTLSTPCKYFPNPDFP